MNQITLINKIRRVAVKAIVATKFPGSARLGYRIMPASDRASTDRFVESTVALKKASIPIVARLSTAYPDIAVWLKDDSVNLLEGGHLIFTGAMVCMCEFWTDDTIHSAFRSFVHSFDTFSVFMRYFHAIPSYLVEKGYMDRETGLIRSDITEDEKAQMHKEMASIMADWLTEAKIQMWTYDELIEEFIRIFSKGKHVPN